MSSSVFQKHLQHAKVLHGYYKTAAGLLQVSAIEKGIFKAEFTDKRDTNVECADLPLSTLLLVGTSFQIKVWQALLTIAEGNTTHYQAIATLIGLSNGERAVAKAISGNNIAYLLPCHRVIRKDGSLAGYKWGIEKKRLLLTHELKANVFFD